MILLLFIIMKTKAVPHVSILVPSIMQNEKKKHPLNHPPPPPDNDNYTHAGICLERGSCDACVFSNWVSIKCAHTNIYQGTRWGHLIFSSSIRRLRLHTKEESVYYRGESNNNEVITSAGNFHSILLFNRIPWLKAVVSCSFICSAPLFARYFLWLLSY